MPTRFQRAPAVNHQRPNPISVDGGYVRALDAERAQVGFGPVRLNGLSQPNQNSVGHILRGGNGKFIDKRKDVYIFTSVYVCMYVYVNDKSGGSPIATGSNIGCHLFGICSLCTLIISLSVYICVCMCLYIHTIFIRSYRCGLSPARAARRWQCQRTSTPSLTSSDPMRCQIRNSKGQ